MATLEAEQDASPLLSAARFMIACLMAPLAPWLVFLCLSLFSGDVAGGLWSFQLFAAAGYPALFLLGLPIHFLFRKLGWKNLFFHALAGLLVGDAIVVAFGFTRDIGLLEMGAIIGTIAASSFWLIARPDRAEV